MSSKRLQDMPSRRFQDMSSRCLQDVSSRRLEGVFSVTIFRLPTRLQFPQVTLRLKAKILERAGLGWQTEIVHANS